MSGLAAALSGPTAQPDLNTLLMQHLETQDSTNKARRERAPIACMSCRARRVRCDAFFRNSYCSNCRFDSTECCITPHKRTARHLKQQVLRTASNAPKPGESGVRQAGNNRQRDREGEGHGTNAAKDNPAQQHGLLSDPTRPMHISEAEFSLLRDQGIFTLPSQELRYELVNIYTRHVYGHLPIMAVSDLVTIVEPDRYFPFFPNWFVVMALFAVSAHFLDPRFWGGLGVASQQEASRYFYNKAETLYRFRWDEYKYAGLQGVLFMGFCERELYGNDGWSWAWTAYTTAVAMRLDSEPLTRNRNERSYRRRIWWACYSQCCLVNFSSRDGKRYIVVPDGGVAPPRLVDLDDDEPPGDLAGLVAFATSIRDGWLRFVERVRVLQIYNEFSLREQTVRQCETGISETLGQFEAILRAATKSRLLDLLGPSSEVVETGVETGIASVGDQGCPLLQQNAEDCIEASLETEFATCSMMLMDLERLIFNGL